MPLVALKEHYICIFQLMGVLAWNSYCFLVGILYVASKRPPHPVQTGPTLDTYRVPSWPTPPVSKALLLQRYCRTSWPCSLCSLVALWWWSCWWWCRWPERFGTTCCCLFGGRRCCSGRMMRHQWAKRKISISVNCIKVHRFVFNCRIKTSGSWPRGNKGPSCLSPVTTTPSVFNQQ